MITILYDLFAFVLALGLLITLHELGHFLMARFFKFPTPIFSIGFGPKLFSVTRGGVEYRLSAFPIGGYVKILGMGYDESSVVGKDEDKVETRGKRWQRALILASGPCMNILLAVILIAGVYMAGVTEWRFQGEPALVGWVEPDSPAAGAGIRVGDTITAINGRAIPTWEKVSREILVSGGDRITLTLLRDGKKREVFLRIERVGDYDIGYIGVGPPTTVKIKQVIPGGPAEKAGLKAGDIILKIDDIPIRGIKECSSILSRRPDQALTLTIKRGPSVITKEVHTLKRAGKGILRVYLAVDEGDFVLRRYSLFKSLKVSVQSNLADATLALQVVQRLVRGKTSIKQMSGPIDIAKFSGMALKSGWNNFINFTGRISLQLGIFNLLPLPILDGGYLLILFIEGLRRRDLSMKLKERVLTAGFYLLVLLMAVIIYIDIVRNVFG